MGKLSVRLKNIKGLPMIIIGLIAGLVLIVAGNFGFGSSKKAQETVEISATKSEDLNEYRKTLENQIKDLIEKMDGVSNVSVMITFDQGSSSVYAQDGTYIDGTATSKKYVLNDGDKPITVTIVCPKVRGVAVVCGGGSNPVIAGKVINLICALFDLNSNKVFVSG